MINDKKNQDKEVKEEKFANRDDLIEKLRKDFFEIANDILEAIPVSIKKAEEWNTVEPVVVMFEAFLGAIASLVAVKTQFDDDDMFKLYTCEKCIKNKFCEIYQKYRESKEMEKQGKLFEFPVIYSSEKH